MRTIRYEGLITAIEVRNAVLSEHGEVRGRAEAIIEEVRKQGDNALRRLGDLYDGTSTKSLSVSEFEIEEAANKVSLDLKKSIDIACARVEIFHRNQVTKDFEISDTFGNCFGQKTSPLNRVGLYVPGGSAVLFSTLYMLAVPARIAGVQSIVVMTPCGGTLAPELAYVIKKI